MHTPHTEEYFMSIRALATELYKAQQRVHRLQDRLEKASVSDRDVLRHELRLAQAACSQLRRLMDGEKEPSPFSNNPFKK